jgi:hypothetical protein
MGRAAVAQEEPQPEYSLFFVRADRLFLEPACGAGMYGALRAVPGWTGRPARSVASH